MNTPPLPPAAALAARRHADTPAPGHLAAEAAIAPTIESWRAYYRRGSRRVKFVGLLGNAAIYGAIKRVTTANVFVLVDGAAKAEPFHPADLRPTNVWPGHRPQCKECGIRFEGGRAEARRARWEPLSPATRRPTALGPMVCPACAEQLLAAVFAAADIDDAAVEAAYRHAHPTFVPSTLAKNDRIHGAGGGGIVVGVREAGASITVAWDTMPGVLQNVASGDLTLRARGLTS